MVEHLTFNQTVEGSNPSALIIIKSSKWNIVINSQTKLINFNWILLYTKLYKLILTSHPLLNYFSSFMLKLRMLNKFTILGTSISISNSNTLAKPLLNRKSLFSSPFSKPFLKSQTTVYTKFFNDVNKIALFNLFIQFSTNTNGIFFKPHANFQMFFITFTLRNSPLININKFFAKWIDFYNLLLNIFFSKMSLFIFSNKNFKNEVLSFNWSFNLIEYRLFKHSSQYFFMKGFKPGSAVSVVFKRFLNSGLNIAFILDVKQHEKTLDFCKTIHLYTVGLVPYSMNPWFFSYAIPVYSNDVFIQYFFIKFLTYLRNYSELEFFKQVRSVWLNNLV